MRLYIASAWSRAEWIDTVLRAAVERTGATICSTWHRAPYVRLDPFSSLPKAQREEVYRTNCDEIASCDSMLVILDEMTPDAARPRQTYAELCRAVMLGRDVIVVGPPFPPECEAPTVRAVTSIADAVRAIGEAVEASRRRPTLPSPPLEASECSRVYLLDGEGYEHPSGTPTKCPRPSFALDRDGSPVCAECMEYVSPERDRRVVALDGSGVVRDASYDIAAGDDEPSRGDTVSR